MRISFGLSTEQVARDVLFGGSPARALRLSEAGIRALEELRAGPARSGASAKLARLLTDAGMADPVPGPAPTGLDVTVVVPVRDRLSDLERCLQALRGGPPVVVVDDGSSDASGVEACCAAHGARVIRREISGGPGSARNAALEGIHTELVAFLDSDCVPAPDWISGVAGHFCDPLVAAVAPRIVAVARPEASAAARYAVARSPLDLGDRPGLVAPGARVSYVPTAALIVRSAAIGAGFDEQLRYGEDVDLVWRLAASGWRVRYDPRVRVEHQEPVSWAALLRRRFLYGTSAAPLARRHPRAMAPLVLQPWPALTLAALAARRPMYACAAYLAGVGLLADRLSRAGLPVRAAVRSTTAGVWQSFLGTGRWCSQFAGPALILVLVHPGGSKRQRRWRRFAVVSLLWGPALHDWARKRPGLDPLRFGLGVLADEAAYGAGVWRQCLAERVLSPLVPSMPVRMPFDACNKSDYHSGRSGRLASVRERQGVTRACGRFAKAVSRAFSSPWR